MTPVRLLTRQVCRICQEALPVVQRAARRRGLGLEILDVDEFGLASEFGERVPVVLVDGVEVLSGRFTARELRRALRRRS